MDAYKIVSLLSKEYTDIEEEINFCYIFKEEEPDLQIEKNTEDSQYVSDSVKHRSETAHPIEAHNADKNKNKSDVFPDNIKHSTNVISITKENDVLVVNINPSKDSLDKSKQNTSDSDDEDIIDLDEFYTEMKSLTFTNVNDESNEVSVEYNHIRDVTGHVANQNDDLATNDSSFPNVFESNDVVKSLSCIDKQNSTIEISVLPVEYDNTSPNITASTNTVHEKSDSEASEDSSDEQPLAIIKRRKELYKHHLISSHKADNSDEQNSKIEATTLLKKSIDIKFIEHATPSTSKGFSKVDINNNVNKDNDDDSIGYHSSDFEFISESESELVGVIVNKKSRSKEANMRKFSVSSSELREQRKMYKKINNDYRKDHIIPRGNDYLDLFRLYVPLCGGYMENKAFHVTSMNTEFEGLGFDLNMMPRYDERDDEEHIAEARETAKLIERMYPNENRRRRYLQRPK